MGWLEEVRRRHRERKMRYRVAIGAAVAVYIAILVAFLIVFWVILDRPVAIGLIAHVVMGAASVTIGLVVAFGPRPAIGREPPEHVAAWAFLEGRDVRPDDNHLEDHRL